MQHEAELRRLMLGLRGLALLRGWPTGDPAEAEEQIDAMRRLLGETSSTQPNLVVRDVGLEPAYQLWAQTYDEEPNGLVEIEEAIVRPLLSELPAGQALDAACGTGRLTSMLTDLQHDVVAVDPSWPMLQRARQRGLPATLALGDLRALPIASGSVDLAVCGLALTHFTELRPAVAELARVVKPGGRVLVSDIHPLPAATGGQALPEADDGARLLARNHVHWPSDYMDAFHSAGLQAEQLHEPVVTDAVFEQLANEAVRDAARAALTGLPFAIIWLTRKL